jgi:hypothetical protein
MSDPTPEDDRDLYATFAAVRREEVAHVPPLPMHSQILSGLRHRWWRGRLVAAAVFLAATIAVVLWLLPAKRPAREGSDRAWEQAAAPITTWKPATDFLLDTPVRQLLETVPAIGELHGMALAPQPGGNHRPSRKLLR